MASAVSTPISTDITLTLNVNGEALSVAAMESLEGLEVTTDDVGRSGFKVSFRTVRIAPSGDVYDTLVQFAPDEVFDLQVVVGIGSISVLIMDGVVLKQSLGIRSDGEATVTLYGQDLSVKMDFEEVVVAFAAQDESQIATAIIGAYSDFTASVKAPPKTITPTQDDYLPIQRTTDYKYLKSLAGRYGYRFYLKPDIDGSVMYWGPLEVTPGSGGPLVLGFVPYGNVNSLNVDYDSRAPVVYWGNVQDRTTDVVSAVDVETSSTTAPLLADVGALATQTLIRKEFIKDSTGRLETEAQTWAQGGVDTASWAVSAQGEIDVARYGSVLQPRTTVTLLGVNAIYEGTYYVKSVTHKIKPGSYTQSFELKRGGLASG